MLNTHDNIRHSVPQRSLLGPFYFKIYTKDIIKSVQQNNSIFYADESCLFSSHNTIYTLLENANSDLGLIEKWLDANKLTFDLIYHCIIFEIGKLYQMTLDNS